MVPVHHARFFIDPRLCAGLHNRLQVVLHETEQPQPLVPEIKEMVVAQMRQ